jgi:hypothetical protein
MDLGDHVACHKIHCCQCILVQIACHGFDSSSEDDDDLGPAHAPDAPFSRLVGSSHDLCIGVGPRLTSALAGGVSSPSITFTSTYILVLPFHHTQM